MVFKLNNNSEFLNNLFSTRYLYEIMAWGGPRKYGPYTYEKIRTIYPPRRYILLKDNLL